MLKEGQLWRLLCPPWRNKIGMIIKVAEREVQFLVDDRIVHINKVWLYMEPVGEKS